MTNKKEFTENYIHISFKSENGKAILVDVSFGEALLVRQN